MHDYLAIATWTFGMAAVRKAALLLEAGKPAVLDAVIAGAQEVEDDPTVKSVGYGGIGNSCGMVQLDACVMDGRTLNCGGVAGLENIRHPAALARLVMEKTPHVLLVGDGAKSLALENGFPLETLHTPESVAEWHRRAAEPASRCPARAAPIYQPSWVMTPSRFWLAIGEAIWQGLAPPAV